jgi:hypothetical protein
MSIEEGCPLYIYSWEDVRHEEGVKKVKIR